MSYISEISPAKYKRIGTAFLMKKNPYTNGRSGTQLAEAIYSEFNQQLKPQFEEMRRRGYTDVTFVHSYTKGDKLNEHTDLHRHHFVFTSPHIETAASIIQKDFLGQPSWRERPVRVLDVAWDMRLRKVAGYFQGIGVQYCGEPADLGLVLQEGHLHVPSSSEAMRIRKVVQPIKTRIERGVDHLIPIAPFLKRWGTPSHSIRE